MRQYIEELKEQLHDVMEHPVTLGLVWRTII